MDCSQRMTQGSRVYFTNSRDCCSILEKLDFSRSPTMWGGTRKIRAISLIWNLRVSRNCACSGEMPMGVYFISDGEQVTEKEYVRLLREPIPDQRLSIVQELKPKLKKHVVEALLSGSSKIEPYDTKSQKQPEEE